MTISPEQSSFRDRDGFVFYADDKVFRAIHRDYLQNWNKISNSDFFSRHVSSGKLVGFRPATVLSPGEGFAEVIEVDKIPFISHPSEWCLSQLKAAALLTLDIQLAALEEGFTLKDASAFNVQFRGGYPVFIDLFSFEPYVEGQPWQAYRQFCTHFLGPLMLEKYGMGDLRPALTRSPEGLPLSQCARLLPFWSRMNLGAALHIHLHAGFESRHGGDRKKSGAQLKTTLSRTKALIAQLRSTVKSIEGARRRSEWLPYYDTFSYDPEGFAMKKDFVAAQLSGRRYRLCADLGANTGVFSETASAHCDQVLACDHDPAVIAAMHAKPARNILPLVADLFNPTPAFGWRSRERSAFVDRLRACDVVLALALIHHLCIGNNLPMNELAAFFADMEADLIIEFVPKEDPQAQRLLVTRKDVFADYTLGSFRSAFSDRFETVAETPLPGTGRIMFFFRRKGDGKGAA